MGPIKWMLRIFLSIGVIFIVIGAYLFLQDWETLSWKETEGVVNESRVLHLGVRRYVASVEYRYVVDGEMMQGTVVESGPDIPTYSSAAPPRRVVARYPVGKKVIVYFDPQDPSKAILEPGLSRGSLLIFILGMGFVGISLIVRNEFFGKRTVN